MKTQKITIGIDASNILAGGGVHHLIETLRVADPNLHAFEKVVVWGAEDILSQFESKPWLTRIALPKTVDGLIRRVLWQRYTLTKSAVSLGCDVLFIPGGSYYGNFYPIVTMSQNLLPFEWKEIMRYGYTKSTLRLLALRYVQSNTFRKSAGVIFLTHYAHHVTTAIVQLRQTKVSVIPHGVSPRFRMMPKTQKSIKEYTHDYPFRLLYVSTVDVYKHQWHVVEAVKILRDKGYMVSLDMVGGAHPPSLLRLKTIIDTVDPSASFIRYHGLLAYEQLHSQYARSDAFVFASSCETFGQVVTEAMSSGLPIACSEMSAMQELLGSSAVYFNPENSNSIARSLIELLESRALRERISNEVFQKVEKYTWQDCALRTFAFIRNSIKH